MGQQIAWQIGSTASILEVPQASHGTSHMVAVAHGAGIGLTPRQWRLLRGIIGCWCANQLGDGQVVIEATMPT